MSFTSLLSALSLLLQLDQGPALKVTVTPHFSHDPGSFLVTVHVRRDAGNQVLTLTADSLDFVRSGSIELDGADAALRYVRMFDDLPAGSYVIRVEVERQNRTPLVDEVPVRVLGRAGIR